MVETGTRSEPSAANAADAADAADAPLAGVRVVEISMYVQAPVTGLALASLGADVVKIEQVGHQDLMRSSSGLYGVQLDDRGRDWIYAALNRGKRSLALDVAGEAGRAVFHRLVEEADVFVTNLREAGLRRMGADADTLCALNPRLVYARGGGFAHTGPLADLPCQDTVGMAYGGFMDLTSTTEEPNYPPGALSDVLTGTNLAAAVLAGLVRRGLRGTGGVVSATQVQSLIWLQLLPVGMAASIGARMTRFSPSDPPNPLFHVYRTSDGWIAIAGIHPDHWPPIAEALGLGHLLDDPRYATWSALFEHRDEVTVLLGQALARRPTREWWDALRQRGAWSAPVNDVADLGHDRHVLDNGYLSTFPDGFTAPPGPFDVAGWQALDTTAAAYGEHTDEVLAELGYGPDEVEALRVAAAVW